MVGGFNTECKYYSDWGPPVQKGPVCCQLCLTYGRLDRLRQKGTVPSLQALGQIVNNYFSQVINIRDSIVTSKPQRFTSTNDQTVYTHTPVVVTLTAGELRHFYSHYFSCAFITYLCTFQRNSILIRYFGGCFGLKIQHINAIQGHSVVFQVSLEVSL